jgi:hypothetical protein
MASTYTINTGIELIANGEQSGTWGDTTNTNLEIIDRLTNGVGSITLSGTTHTLTTADGALSDGQYKVLVFGGAPSGTNNVTLSPNNQAKQYFVALTALVKASSCRKARARIVTSCGWRHRHCLCGWRRRKRKRHQLGDRSVWCASCR